MATNVPDLSRLFADDNVGSGESMGSGDLCSSQEEADGVYSDPKVIISVNLCLICWNKTILSLVNPVKELIL